MIKLWFYFLKSKFEWLDFNSLSWKKISQRSWISNEVYLLFIQKNQLKKKHFISLNNLSNLNSTLKRYIHFFFFLCPRCKYCLWKKMEHIAKQNIDDEIKKFSSDIYIYLLKKNYLRFRTVFISTWGTMMSLKGWRMRRRLGMRFVDILFIIISVVDIRVWSEGGLT